MVVRPLRRSVRPRAIIPTPARSANQSGKPVKGSTPEPTDAIAPRTPPAGPELPPVAVTPATPPAFGEAPCALVPPNTLAPTVPTVVVPVVPPVVLPCEQDAVE